MPNLNRDLNPKQIVEDLRCNKVEEMLKYFKYETIKKS